VHVCFPVKTNRRQIYDPVKIESILNDCYFYGKYMKFE